jgi:MFS family permease
MAGTPRHETSSTWFLDSTAPGFPSMMPNYLVDYLHLTAPQMGFVMSAIGFGGFVGQFGIPGLSDLFGRRIGLSDGHGSRPP